MMGSADFCTGDLEGHPLAKADMGEAVEAREDKQARKGNDDPTLPGVRYCVEGNGWSIAEDGYALVNALRSNHAPFPATVIEHTRNCRGQVIHFGSIWSFTACIADTHPDNRLIVTVFHGSETMEPAMAPGFQALRRHLSRLDRVVVSCTIMEDRLLAWGVPREKLVRLPLGVDLGRMRPTASALRAEMRRRLGIPDDAFCIGSFQKDGAGWEEGLEPKRVKGPDILLDALSRLAGRLKLFVLLTGPARGYVKAGLERLGIPYRHDKLQNIDEVSARYGALDAYAVASREEGGPKAVLESMACGIPLVTTRVGMAADLVRHGQNGWIVPVEDAAAIADGLWHIATDKDLSGELSRAGRETVQALDWQIVARRYQSLLYEPTLQRLELNQSPLSV